MNNYKFRGKRKDNGEWVYGSLINNLFVDISKVPNALVCYIIPDTAEGQTPPYYDCWQDVAEWIDEYEVIPETVGMWTGLKDKKGVDIYEGDIVEFVGGTTHYLSCGNYADDDYSIGQILVVRYLKSGFTLSSSDILNYDAPNVVGNVKQYDFWNHQNSLKVIGSIHEHPHLLTPAKGAVTHTMNTDPNLQAAESTNEQATTEQVAAVEQEAQEQAMDSAEEGGTEG